MAKPDKRPRWADTIGATKTEPDESKKDIGWINLEKPKFDWFNWLLFYIYDWLRFLYDEMISPGHNDDGTHKDNVIDTDNIVDDAVTGPKIDAAVAGNGLSQGESGALHVNAGTGIVVGANDVGIADDGVGNTQLANMAARTIKGNPTASVADPSDIAAATDGHVLRRSGTTLGFGQIVEAGIGNDQVSNAKLANMAARTIKGNPAASAADPSDIAAATDGHVLRRSGTTLGFGQIVNAGIADDAVTAAKLGAVVEANKPIQQDGSGNIISQMSQQAAPNGVISSVANKYDGTVIWVQHRLQGDNETVEVLLNDELDFHGRMLAWILGDAADGTIMSTLSYMVGQLFTGGTWLVDYSGVGDHPPLSLGVSQVPWGTSEVVIPIFDASPLIQSLVITTGHDLKLRAVNTAAIDINYYGVIFVSPQIENS